MEHCFKFYIEKFNEQFFRVTNEQYKWSYVCGPCPEPLLGLTIGNAVDRASVMFGGREAVVSIHQDLRISFSQLKDHVRVYTFIVFDSQAFEKLLNHEIRISLR